MLNQYANLNQDRANENPNRKFLSDSEEDGRLLRMSFGEFKAHFKKTQVPPSEAMVLPCDKLEVLYELFPEWYFENVIPPRHLFNISQIEIVTRKTVFDKSRAKKVFREMKSVGSFDYIDKSYLKKITSYVNKKW